MLTPTADPAAGVDGDNATLHARSGTNENASVAGQPGPSALTATRRSHAGPLLLYTLLAAFFMLPFASTCVVDSPAGDLTAHLSGIIEARNALREGQFPVRVAPNQLDGRRYPILQFYGNFPYTMGAVLTFVPGVNPYTAWKLVTFLFVAAAGFYTYRSALVLTRQTWPAVVAGVVFVLAPYVSTDIRARFAYAEAVSFCLLPAVFYYSWRAFASRRRAARAIVLGGVCWSIVATSHNITYLYASALIGLFFLTMLSLRRAKDSQRMLRVGACYGLGMALAWWYLAAQLTGLSYITIAQNSGTPLWSTTYVPLRVLLSPLLTISPTAVGTPNLGLQVGWMILAASALGVLLLAKHFGPRDFQRAMLLRLLAALLLAFLIVWSPFNFWRWVPRLFYNVQFTYRVLMLVVLWGSLVAAVTLAMAFRGRRGMPPAAAWACLVATAVMAMPYAIWRHTKLDRGAVSRLIARPDLGGQAAVAYVPSPARLTSTQITPPPGVPIIPASETARALQYGKRTVYFATPTQRVVAQLPVIFYAGLLDVKLNGRRAPHGQVDGLLALEMPAGPGVVEVQFSGVRWANRVSGVAWLCVLVAGAVALRSRLAARRNASPPRNAPVFPLRAGAFGFVLLAVPLALPAAYTPVRKFFERRAAGSVKASSESARGMRAANAFDGDPRTAWSASGSGPAVLTLQSPRERRVARVVLEPRRTILLEGWHKVGVVLYLKGAKAGEQVFLLPDAPSQPVQELRLDRPGTADRVEFHFADPVTVTPDGGQVFDPAVVNPGYSEIRVYSD